MRKEKRGEENGQMVCNYMGEKAEKIHIKILSVRGS